MAIAVIEGDSFKRLMHEVVPSLKIHSRDYIQEQLTLKYETVSMRMIKNNY